MNLLKLNDHQLAALQQAISNEAKRLSQLAVNGHDAANIICGNEAAKRAVQVAAAGHHSILFVGPANSGKTMLRAACLELGLEETYEARRCPCGYCDDPLTACKCTPKQIERAVSRFPAVDITVEVCRPRDRDKNYKGTSLAQMREFIGKISHFTDESLEHEAANLLKATTREWNLDLVAVARILSVARTIANLEHYERIGVPHVCEAINYRAFRY